MNALAARRRHPAAIAILLFLGLALVGTAYSLLAPKPAQAAVATADDAELGEVLDSALASATAGVADRGERDFASISALGREVGHAEPSTLGSGEPQEWFEQLSGELAGRIDRGLEQCLCAGRRLEDEAHDREQRVGDGVDGAHTT